MTAEEQVWAAAADATGYRGFAHNILGDPRRHCAVRSMGATRRAVRSVRGMEAPVSCSCGMNGGAAALVGAARAICAVYIMMPRRTRRRRQKFLRP